MKLTIQGTLTSLNEYIRKERGNKYAANYCKTKETERVAWECKAQQLSAYTKPVIIEYRWYMKNNRKDLDNVCFAKKFINDGLVMAGILFDDSPKWVKGFRDKFYLDKKNPRIEVLFFTL